MELMRLLRQVARNQSGIRLLNIFKGLPITYETNILAVGESEIQVPGSRSQIACLYYQGESFLQSDEFPFVIRSKVKTLNLAQDYAVLSNFEVAKANIGKRMHIRVEPDDSLVASVQFKGSAFEFMTPLADISTNGARVFFENFTFPARLSQPGSELTMTLSISDFVSRIQKKSLSRAGSEIRKVTPPLYSTLTTGQNGRIVITANGKVISVRPDADKKRYLVSAHLYFKDLSRVVIKQYISHRQAEIIKDLRLLAEDLYNRKR